MRIQILELPTVVVGEQVTTPFALIVDQVEHPSRVQGAVNLFQEQTGARATLLTQETVEVMQ